MNDNEKSRIKVGIAIAAFSILFYLILKNFNAVTSAFSWVAGLMGSFLIGVCIAFVLNVLMNLFELKLFPRIKVFDRPKLKKFKRPTALVLTLLVFFGIVTILISFIIPQFVESAKMLGANMNGYIASAETFLNGMLERFGISTNLNETIAELFTSISSYIIKFVETAAPKLIEATISFGTGVLNAFIGFIFAIYMLASKESLLHNAKRLIYAFLPLKAADYTKSVYRLVKTRFTGFVAGQLTEAVIVGVLCFIGMSIGRMEYALLISVIIAVTNMIPVIGPIIGAIPGALIMLLVDPVKALWFVLFIVVLQQVESNLIYPKVVGDSIGLPGIWVLFAIIVGGNLFGFLGVLLGVPVFAVIYTLLGKHTLAILKKKKLKI